MHPKKVLINIDRCQQTKDSIIYSKQVNGVFYNWIYPKYCNRKVIACELT
jgi:hypothetical protein